MSANPSHLAQVRRSDIARLAVSNASFARGARIRCSSLANEAHHQCKPIFDHCGHLSRVPYIYRVMHWRFHRLNSKSPQQMTHLLAALTDPEHAAACEMRVKSSRDKRAIVGQPKPAVQVTETCA